MGNGLGGQKLPAICGKDWGVSVAGNPPEAPLLANAHTSTMAV
jgi:hypothetical protein